MRHIVSNYISICDEHEVLFYKTVKAYLNTIVSGRPTLTKRSAARKE